MLALAYAEGVRVVFKGHTYNFGDKFYLQLEGGPIGLRLTAMIARLICLWFDFMFSTRCISLGIMMLMYKRYVDNINLASKRIHNTIKYNPRTQSLVQSENPTEVSPDVHTFEVLKKIANDITPMFR